MPYISEKQRRFMYSQHPEIAKRWDREGKNYISGKGGGFIDTLKNFLGFGNAGQVQGATAKGLPNPTPTETDQQWRKRRMDIIKKGGRLSLNVTPEEEAAMNANTTPSDHERAIRGFFEDYGAPAATLSATFAKEAAKYPITQKYPYLIPALSINETSGGKNVTHPNNMLNWGIYEPTFQPKTPQEVIEKATSGIGQRMPYYEKFRQTGDLEEFANHYAPPSENNTSQYVKNLKSLMQKIGSYR